MKKKATIIAALFLAGMLSLAFQTAPAYSELIFIEDINIGDPTSEAGHSLSGWGPVEPATHGGGWGGGDDGTIRVAYAPSIGDTDKSASFTMNTGTADDQLLLVLRVLDGIANDNFKVEVDYLTGPVYTYTSDPSTTEYWVTHYVILARGYGSSITVTITATGPDWWGVETWGQLGVSWVKLYEVNGPADTGKYDEFGYNYKARIFNGLFGQADRNADGDAGKYWGYPTDDTPLVDGTLVSIPVGGTWLVMKWDKKWDAAVFGPDGIRNSGDEAPWQIGAWVTNHDEVAPGMTGSITWPDGSTTTIYSFIFYKIIYVESGGNFIGWGAAPDGSGKFNVIIQDYA